MRAGFLHRTIAAAGIALLGVVLLLFLWSVSTILLLAFAGVLFGLFLHGGAEWLSRRSRIPLQASLSVLLVLFVLAFGIGTYFAAPRIAEQADALSDTIPALLGELRKTLGKYEWGQLVLREMNTLDVESGSVLGGIRGLANALTWIVIGVLVVFFTGLYLAFNPVPYRHGLLALIPPHRHKRAREVLAVLKRQLQRWLLGRLVSMLAIAVLTGVGLSVLGVPLAFTLAVFAGFLSFIPNIGPTLSAILAATVALTEGWRLALYTVLLFVGVQLVESYLITPYIEKRAVYLPPAFVILVQLIMGFLFGFAGLLVATPLAVVIVIVVKMLYVEDALGADVEAPWEKTS